MSDPITCNWLVLGLALYLSKLAGGAGVPRQVPPPPWERSSDPQVQDLAPATSTSTGAHVSGPRLIFIFFYVFLTFFVPSQIFTSYSCSSWLLRIKQAFNWQRSAQKARQRHFQVFFVFPSSPIDEKQLLLFLTWDDQLKDFLTSPTKPWKNLVTLRHLDTGP